MTILCRLERPQEVLFRLVAELVAASAAISVLEIQYISAGRAGVELHRANRTLIVPCLRSLEPGRNIPSSSDVSRLAALNLPCWVACVRRHCWRASTPLSASRRGRILRVMIA